MRLFPLSIFGTLALAYGQAPVVAIRPGRVNLAGNASSHIANNSKLSIGTPTLGYIRDAEGLGLIPIRGVASASSAGDLVPAPASANRVFLPPRQHYALTELETPYGIAVWHLARTHVVNGLDVLDRIQQALPHPELVSFSPTGKTAALYSTVSGQVQVIAGLPGNPVIQSQFSTAPFNQLSTLLVSDDGRVLVGGTSSGQILLSSDGNAFRAMPWTYVPRAMSFVSNSHNLLISDAAQKQLFLLENVDLPNSPPRVIGTSLEPDHIAVCTHGETFVALDSAGQKLWQIDANSLTVTPLAVTQQADTLLTLRDGHTVLLSTSPLWVIRLTDADSPVADTAAVKVGKQ
jgi:hypothetical protein